MNSLISVVVPVYNTDTVLFEKCLNSLLAQTYESIEIILVDDGSTNGVERSCDEWSKKYSIIKTIHQRNKGLAAARNTGQKAAQGNWMMFLDSDDWLDENTCSSLIKASNKHRNIDLIVWGFTHHFGKTRNECVFKYEDGFFMHGGQCKELLYDALEIPSVFSSSCWKLYNIDFLRNNDLWHNEEIQQGSEDLEFMIRVLDRIDSALMKNERFYHYIMNTNSITNHFNESNAYYVLKCFMTIEEYISRKNDSELMKKFYNRSWYAICSSLISGFMNPNNGLSYNIRISKTKNYLNEDFVKKVIDYTYKKRLHISRRFILICIVKKWYMPITLIAKIRNIQKRR